MAYYYSDPTRASDPHALPDVETFGANYGYCAECGDVVQSPDCKYGACHACDDRLLTLTEFGWFWWSCFPGCLPDSDPVGPFPTEAEALADARDASGLCPHGVEDGHACAECPAPELWVLCAPDDPTRVLHYRMGSVRESGPQDCAAWGSEAHALAQRDALGLTAHLIARRLSNDEARTWGTLDN